jgi:hypothetical protein
LTNGKTAAAFPELNALLEDCPEMSLTDLVNIFMYTQNKLEVEINRCMPENVELQKRSWVRNPIALDSTEYGDDIPVFQVKMTDLQDNQAQREHSAQIPCSGF